MMIEKNIADLRNHLERMKANKNRIKKRLEQTMEVIMDKAIE